MGWLIAIIVVLLALAGYASVTDAREWEAFRVAHKCREVAHIEGDVFNTVGFGSNGQAVIGIGSTPDKTGWACDDGKTYYR